MIVQCEKCRTKFRVPDEKIGQTGAKVRCSKCAHVFLVKNEAVPAAPNPTSTEDLFDSALASAGIFGQASKFDIPMAPPPPEADPSHFSSSSKLSSVSEKASGVVDPANPSVFEPTQVPDFAFFDPGTNATSASSDDLRFPALSHDLAPKQAQGTNPTVPPANLARVQLARPTMHNELGTPSEEGNPFENLNLDTESAANAPSKRQTETNPFDAPNPEDDFFNLVAAQPASPFSVDLSPGSSIAVRDSVSAPIPTLRPSLGTPSPLNEHAALTKAFDEDNFHDEASNFREETRVATTALLDSARKKSKPSALEREEQNLDPRDSKHALTGKSPWTNNRRWTMAIGALLGLAALWFTTEFKNMGTQIPGEKTLGENIRVLNLKTKLMPSTEGPIWVVRGIAARKKPPLPKTLIATVRAVHNNEVIAEQNVRVGQLRSPEQIAHQSFENIQKGLLADESKAPEELTEKPFMAVFQDLPTGKSPFHLEVHFHGGQMPEGLLEAPPK